MAKSPYAELPEPLKKSLPDMFSSYPGLFRPSPSSWFVWKDSGEVIAHNRAVCHAQMYYDGVGWDNLITAVPKNDLLSLEYLRMLIRGPFRSMSDLIRLDRIGSNYYLHCLSLGKWPANVLMNFCIASRVPIEFDLFLEPWAKRCELGFEPVLAFLLTTSYGAKYSSNEQFADRTFNVARGGHMWLDPASSWYHILHGITQNVSKSFKTNPELAKPANVIWGKSNDYTQLIKMTDDQIAELYTQPIQVLEEPPPPVIKPKKKGQLQFVYGGGLANVNMQQAFNHLNDLAGQVHDDIIPVPQWAIQPAIPQPQPVEPIHEPEDDFDEPPIEWFEPDDDD